jgi:hypothetical protein
MGIVDRIDSQQVEKLMEEQKDDLFTQLIMGKDYVEEIETSRGNFTVKFARAADDLAIGKIAAVRRNFRPVEGFDDGAEMTNIMASTLDVVVVSGPKWFEDAKKLNKNFTFLEVPSRTFIAELYGKAYSFRDKIEKSLNEEGEPANQGVPSEPGGNGAMGDGAFEGLSSELPIGAGS